MVLGQGRKSETDWLRKGIRDTNTEEEKCSRSEGCIVKTVAVQRRLAESESS